MKLFLILALALCAYAVDVKETEDKAETTQNKDKRQTQDEIVQEDIIYRIPRKQEQVAPVEEPQEEDKIRTTNEEYRPGQVFSLNAQELLELQPERRAPLSGDHLLQQLYTTSPQQEHKQNLQQVYYLEPQQVGRQVSLQPSHAVIARPHFSSNGGEASVGAALSVSDTGANNAQNSFDQELLTLLSHSAREEESRQQEYSQSQSIQQTSAPNLAPQQHQQIERYINKPVKKITKQRSKVQISPPQSPAAPQQYLIETTNVQQQQPALQYRPAPQHQRALQSLRYVPIQQAQPAVQQVIYERPESQGLKIVPAPKLQPLQLQQARQPLAYRIVPQYQQPEATPKQYRIIEPRPQPIRQESRAHISAERPVTYLKRYPEPEKMRAVKIYDPIELSIPQQHQQPQQPQQPAQIVGEQYYLRSVYRQNEQRGRYELPVPLRPVEQPRPVEATKAPASAIYVSKNIAPKNVRPKLVRPEQNIQSSQHQRFEQPGLEAGVHQQHSLDDQRAHLPPPRNNKAYTPEEFAALVAAGYSVTPIPVSSSSVAQSRSSGEESSAPAKRRTIYRRPQYLPIRDDAP